MEKRGATHRADLTIAKETTQWNVTKFVTEKTRVMVRLPIKVFASSEA